MKALNAKQAEVLDEFRQKLGAKLTEAGIEFKWPADDSFAVEVPGEHADQADGLVREVLDGWGRS